MYNNDSIDSETGTEKRVIKISKKTIDAGQISIHKATLLDLNFLYRIKSEKHNIYWTGHTSKPDYVTLKKWYEKILLNNKRIIYIILYLSKQVGYIYIDILDKEIELSIAISEKYARKGLGTQSVRKILGIIEKNDNHLPITAKIFDCNIASIKLFTKLGWFPTEETELRLFPLRNANELMRKYIYKKNFGV